MQNLYDLKRAAKMTGISVEDLIKRKIELKHQGIEVLADEIVRIQGEIDRLMGMLDGK